MPSFDPNILLGLLQSQQGGQPLPTSVPGVPDQMMPQVQQRLGAMNPDMMSTLTTGLQNYAPNWQQGDKWNLQSIRGGGFGQGMGGGGMGNPNPGSMGQGGFGGRFGGGDNGAGGGMGMRGRGGK